MSRDRPKPVKGAAATNPLRKAPRLIGYARVSTGDQNLDVQEAELRAAGCTEIFTDVASGGTRQRPGLKLALDALKGGDTLIVARLDRAARSLAHLLEICQTVTDRKAFFRSLNDPFEIGSAAGRLMMQMLGAFAEFERRLIKERTRAGIAAARRRGAKIGNPAIVAQDPQALALMKAARYDTTITRTRKEMKDHLPAIRRLRPWTPWEDVLVQINAQRISGKPWKLTSLKRRVHRLVNAGDLDAEILARAKGTQTDLAAGAILRILRHNPEINDADLATRLNQERVSPPRAFSWTPELAGKNRRKLG